MSDVSLEVVKTDAGYEVQLTSRLLNQKTRTIRVFPSEWGAVGFVMGLYENLLSKSSL